MSSLSEEKRRSLLDAGKMLLRQKLERQGASASPVAVAGAPAVGGVAAAAYLTPQPAQASRPHHVITASGSYLPAVGEAAGAAEVAAPSTPLGARGGAPQQSPRDSSLANKVNELTVEKSNLMAKVFKLEKACADLTASNGQLRQRIASLEDVRSQSGALQASLEQEKQRTDLLQAEVDRLAQAAAASSAQLEDASGTEAHLRDTVQHLLAEKEQLEQQLEKNTEMLQETITNRSQVETMLLQEKQKNAQLERSSREQVEELEAAKSKAEDAVREKEQQIKILYDEAAQKDKENQSTRSLILQKNTMMKQSTATIEQLTAENRQLLQQQQEQQRLVQQQQQQLQALQQSLEERTAQLQTQAAAAAASGAQAQQGQAQAQAHSQLQLRAEALATENNQLRHDAANFAGLLQEMQSNFDMMTELYEAKLQQAQQELEAAKAAPQPARDVEQVLAAGRAEGEGQASCSAGGAVGEFEKELHALQKLRESQRQHTWVVPEGGSLSVEYMQEERIHQLLEEIGQMDLLLAKAPALVQTARQAIGGGGVAALEARLQEQERATRQAQQESELLLHAIESGDLQPYADLKMQQQAEAAARKQLQEEQIQQEQEQKRAQDTTQHGPAQEGEGTTQQAQKKRKGWFSWLG